MIIISWIFSLFTLASIGNGIEKYGNQRTGFYDQLVAGYINIYDSASDTGTCTLYYICYVIWENSAYGGANIALPHQRFPYILIHIQCIDF